MPYVARRPLTVHGQQVGIGEEVDMSLLPRPESIIRSGKVIWVGDGPRSRDSSTALSGSPTIEKECNPRERSVSTDTK
jgi:Tfp pilus assembly protein PilZ